MESHILLLAVVMLMAGVFGGLVNYYLYQRQGYDLTHLLRCIILGIGASFLVPVVLDLLSSTLVVDSQNDPSRLLIFTGFCLIAAICSRFVNTSHTERLLAEARFAQQQVSSIQHEFRRLQEEVVPLLDLEIEQERNTDNEGSLTEELELDMTGSKVLKTLNSGQYIFRSVAGLCRDAEIDEVTLEKTLHILASRSLAGKITSKVGQRWFVTERGRRLLLQQ
ncbi:YEATS-associated helix-containing protein [Zooshikella harenae]|uniref:YEATS-Like-Associating Three TM domain-containing protein n=1 Tax=Zooshikella harenae TaxID=2827238 RepID=A0ABS5ZEH5_9GAMM|nr:YEATS-associated helix-containing protein [Zooshikella harenae]MBU2712375.1 hypothetical protein [Zooshikella harenae]